MNKKLQKVINSEKIKAIQQQYLKEISDINVKTKEFEKLLRLKEKSNQEKRDEYCSPLKKQISKTIFFVQREKLKEIDINIRKDNLHYKTHYQILNYCATKIQNTFRSYLRRQKVRNRQKVFPGRKSYDFSKKEIFMKEYVQSKKEKESIILIQEAVRNWIIKKKKNELNLRRNIINGYYVLLSFLPKYMLKHAFNQLKNQDRKRDVLSRRISQLIELSKKRHVGILNMNFHKLKILKKSEGKFRMAEYFSSNYKQAQVFYRWLLLLSRKEF